MLRAEAAGVPPEELVAEIAASHQADFERFRISVDNYLTTHSAENNELTAEIYRRLLAAGHIDRHTIQQAYDEQRQMFLPDRYVRRRSDRKLGSVVGKEIGRELRDNGFYASRGHSDDAVTGES